MKELFKALFKGVKPVKMDVVTAAELWNKPIMHVFGAKLYVSHLCPKGCLWVKEEKGSP